MKVIEFYKPDIFTDEAISDDCNIEHLEANFLEACRNGDVDVVEYILSKNICLDVKDDDGRTPLVLAAMFGNDVIVTYILDHGADVCGKYFPDALLKACENGHEKVVKVFAERGANFNVKDSNSYDGKTPLIWACTKGWDNVVELVIECDTDLSIREANGNTALMLASKEGHENIVEMLLKGDADVNAMGLNDTTALMEACRHGHYKVVDMLARAGAELNSRNRDGKSGLLLACEYDHARAVEMLLQHGVDASITSRYGKTVLIWACMEGHEGVADVLIEHGVNLNARDCLGKTAFIWAWEKDHENVVKLLVERGADTDGMDVFILMWACRRGYGSVLEILLDRGVDVNTRDEIGRPALFRACEFGNYEAVEILMTQNVDVNARDWEGKTALMWASCGGHVNVLELLLGQQYGFNNVDLNVKDSEGKTALMWACRAGHIAVLDYLIRWRSETRNNADNTERSDVDVCVKDCNGKTAIMIASENGHLEIVERLIECGSEVNGKDRWGRTALMGACYNGHLSVANALIKCHADVNVRDVGGRTALMMTCRKITLESPYENIRADIVGLLVKHGATTNEQTDKQGWSAVMMAVKANRVRCLERLLLAGANLNLLDKEGFSVFSHAVSMDNTKCLTVLLRSGKLLTKNGRLNPMHKRANVHFVSEESLKLSIKFGIFEWEWCPIEHFRPVALAAMDAGVSPGKIKYHVDNSTSTILVSPLVLSILQNDRDLMETFLKRRYFYPEDYITLRCDANIRSRIADTELLHEILRKPWSLQTWSLLVISKSISVPDLPHMATQRVNCLPIPDRFKRLLNYK